MPTYRAPRGTRDLLPTETPIWTALERLAADLTTRYGYRRIETPLFEQTALFARGQVFDTANCPRGAPTQLCNAGHK